jgi:hypothetical protein
MRTATFALAAVMSLSAQAAAVRVRVVDASTNRPIEKAYTAVVAEDAPWSQPARESIGGGTHEVPAGRYRVVALARGFTTEYERPFALDANATRDVTLTLQPLASLRGRVTAGEKPVRGARIGFAGQFTYDHAATLSPVAEELLRANTMTVSDDDGAFILPALPPEGRMVIVIEADERAPVVLEDARAGDLGGIELEPGASLDVRWSGTRGATHDRISLLPGSPLRLSRERAIHLWTRPLTGNTATWKSLPPGEYEVVLRGRPRAPHDLAPISLATVTLQKGEHRAIELAFPPSAPPQPPTRSPLRLLVRDAKRASLSAARVIFWTDDGAERVDAELAPASGGTLLTLARPCASGDVTIEIAEAIGAVAIRDCSASASLALHPKAAIAARFTAPPGTKLPARGTARTLTCDLAIPFAINEGSATIAVPAKCGAVVLAMSTFAPVAIAARDLAANRAHDTGSVQLREGGAILARVRGIDGAPLAGVTVKAHRRAEVENLRGMTPADSIATLATGVTDERGWTRIYGLPAEELVFSLRAPKRARAHLSDAFRIRTGEELVLDDLTLPPPASVAVTINLASDVEESLFVHSVEAVPAEGNAWPARSSVAAMADGARSVRIDDVPPGAWKIRALGRLAGGTLAILGERRVDVEPGVDQNLTIDVADRVYRGRVVRGTSAVRGTLELQPAKRDDNRRTALATLDDDGGFHVLLERAGDYVASVQETSAKRGARLGSVIRFEDPDDEVIIELPAGRISGRVVRADGAPVADAAISAHRAGTDAMRGDMSGAQSAADGTFALESIGAGTWSLRASVSGAAIEDVVVTASGGETSGITLLVAPTRRTSIRVLEAAGNPARNAFVVLEPPPSDAALPPTAILRRTNGDGVVDMTIPHHLETNPTNVYFMTADQRLSCATLRVDADRTIRLPATHGIVRLRRKAWAPPAAVALRLVSADGCSVPFAGARVEGRDMIVRGLASGSWHFVELSSPQQRLFAFTGRASLLAPMTTFTVEPGKTTIAEIKD